MRRRHLVSRLLASVAEGALLVVALSAPAMAQRISGVVRDSLTGERLNGAVVSALDSAGVLITRNISDTAGRFSLARFRESARISVIRIGYAPRELHLNADDSTITVLMRTIPAELSAVTATSRRVCPGDQQGGQALALWEQARSALLAAVLARQLNAPRIGLLSFSRTREPIRKAIDEETRDSKFVVADRPYVAGRPAWAFAYDGYMREDPGGERTYFAPDEAVMLDETFAGTHCLHAVNGTRDHSDEIGIAFEPIAADGRDTLVDVKGVLWLDRAVRGLRSLDFEYTGLEQTAKGSGGQLTFRVMPNGAPMIQRWSIHSAILATDIERTPSGIVRRLPPRAERTNVRLLGYQETGGEVASAEWSNGLKWRGPFAQFHGVVVDSLGRPASGAIIRLANRTYDDSLTTDSAGRFEFPPAYPGVYRVFLTDSLFASYGAGTTIPRQTVLGPEDNVATLTLRPRTELLRIACVRDRSYVAGTAVIFGRVVGSNGEPATDVHIDASWHDATTPSAREVKRGAKTDDAGRFVICGAALNGDVDLTTSTRRESAAIHLDALKSDVNGVTLVLKPRRP